MFIAWRGGDPCQLCTGPIKRTGSHWGLCWAHWLGANQLQRALAAFEYYWDHEEDRMEADLRSDLDAYGHEVA
jgi:predicted transcriptional regulator YdeE